MVVVTREAERGNTARDSHTAGIHLGALREPAPRRQRRRQCWASGWPGSSRGRGSSSRSSRRWSACSPAQRGGRGRCQAAGRLRWRARPDRAAFSKRTEIHLSARCRGLGAPAQASGAPSNCSLRPGRLTLAPARFDHRPGVTPGQPRCTDPLFAAARCAAAAAGTRLPPALSTPKTAMGRHKKEDTLVGKRVVAPRSLWPDYPLPRGQTGWEGEAGTGVWVRAWRRPGPADGPCSAGSTSRAAPFFVTLQARWASGKTPPT